MTNKKLPKAPNLTIGSTFFDLSKFPHYETFWIGICDCMTSEFKERLQRAPYDRSPWDGNVFWKFCSFNNDETHKEKMKENLPVDGNASWWDFENLGGNGLETRKLTLLVKISATAYGISSFKLFLDAYVKYCLESHFLEDINGFKDKEGRIKQIVHAIDSRYANFNEALSVARQKNRVVTSSSQSATNNDLSRQTIPNKCTLLSSLIQKPIYSHDSELSLDPLNHTSIKLYGRELELKQLDKFITSPTLFNLQFVIGPSGAGKTRLIFEWLKDYVSSDAWQVGYIAKESDADKWLDWKSRPTNCNTLIVVDYISRFTSAAKLIIQKGVEHAERNIDITNQSSEKGIPKIRLVILDRVLPDAIEFRTLDNNHKTILGETVSELKYRLSYSSPPIYLNRIEEEKNFEMLKRIIVDTSGYPTDSPEVDLALSVLKKYNSKQQNYVCYPLFAILIGQTLKEAQKEYTDTINSWKRSDLIDYYLSSKNRLPWKSDKKMGGWFGASISAATLIKGVEYHCLFSSLPNADDIDGEYKENFITQCNQVVSSYDKQKLKPFEPDIFGENFFLLFFQFFSSKHDIRTSFFKMLENKRSKDDELPSPNNSVIQFVKNIARNLSNDEQDSPYVQEGWVTLLDFLDTKHYQNNSNMLLTANFARIEVDKVLSEESNE